MPISHSTPLAVRRLLLALGAALCAVGLPCGALPASERPAEKPAAGKPNIVVIIADDLGWADIGYHESDTLTPHLDKLAAGGARLEHHYVFPSCSPTRAALLSGRGPSRYGIYGAIGGKSSLHLPTETFTLPRALKTVGYTTHIAGKWHLGLRPEVGPRQYGFDTTYGYLHGQIDPYTHLYKFGDRTWHRNDQLIDHEEGHATDLITAEALRVIRQPHQQPYFLYVAYNVPHYPLSEPEEYTKLYDGKIKDHWRKQNAASITHMDAGIGQMVAALDSTGQRENTILLFLSDNGGQESWNAPKSQYNGKFEPHTTLGNNLPLRGWKTQLLEGGIRVPALVNWPGHVRENQVVDAPLQVMDWMPTLCGLAGCELPAETQQEGLDVWPLITGRQQPEPRTMYYTEGRAVSVRQGDWKLLSSRTLEDFQLFNLNDDPYETTDLADQQPQRLAEMKQVLKLQMSRDKGR